MDTLIDPHDWAASEFGHAAIPDARNVARLVQMAQRVAERPLPKVSAVFEAPPELEAAFDFLENERIRPQALVASCQRATARRARGLARILVPVDEVLLTLPDPHATRGMGSVGERATGTRGLIVMVAVALDERGTPLGLAAMITWARPLVRDPRPHHRRPALEKEIRYWIHARRPRSASRAARRGRPEHRDRLRARLRLRRLAGAARRRGARLPGARADRAALLAGSSRLGPEWQPHAPAFAAAAADPGTMAVGSGSRTTARWRGGRIEVRTREVTL